MTALLPKEHGAWAQMALPLLTVTAIAGPSPFAVAVVCGFLVHEPLLVWLGVRGTRARRDLGPWARRWTALLATTGVTAGLATVAALAPERRWTLLLPLLPAVAVAAEMARGRSRSALSALAAAAAFSLAAVPAAVAAGAPLASGVAVALPFVVVFVAATVAVRSITRRHRASGTATPSRQWRFAAVTLAVAGAVTLRALADGAALPWVAVWAALPGLAVAAGLALVAPPPRHLKRVGWLLAGASVAASVLLMTTR